MTLSAPGTVIVSSMTSTPPSLSASITRSASSPDGARTTGMSPPSAIRLIVSVLTIARLLPGGVAASYVVLAVRGEYVEDDRCFERARGVLDAAA